VIPLHGNHIVSLAPVDVNPHLVFNATPSGAASRISRLMPVFDGGALRMFSWLFRTKAKKPKVAVVGAGIAGLTAATTLKQGGVDVTLFEAGGQAGGRMLTHQTDWALIDHGAQYFTARDPHFRSQAERWLRDGIIKVWEFEPYCFDEGILRPSPDREVRYVGIGGMQHLPTVLAANLDIRYGQEIREIDNKGSQFTLTS